MAEQLDPGGSGGGGGGSSQTESNEDDDREETINENLKRGRGDRETSTTDRDQQSERRDTSSGGSTGDDTSSSSDRTTDTTTNRQRQTGPRSGRDGQSLPDQTGGGTGQSPPEQTQINADQTQPPADTQTDSRQERFIEENFQETSRTQRAPDSARQLRSGQGQDATILFDQGLEEGEGDVAVQADEVEQQVLENNPGLDESDVLVTLNDDNQFQVDLTEEGTQAFREQQEASAEDILTGASGTLNETAAMNRPEDDDAFSSLQEGESQGGETIQRVSEIGGDATTAADRDLQRGEQNERVREDVVRQIEEQGIDSGDVDINVQRTEGGFTAEVTAKEQDEQFGDYAIRFPGLGDNESSSEENIENVIGTVATPFGPNADEIAESAFTASGLSGKRFENVLGDTSDAIRDGSRELGKRAAVASPIPYLAGRALGGKRGAKGAVDFQTSFVEGGALLADVPGVALGVKELGELGVYGTKETASGRGEELRGQLSAAAVSAGSGAIKSATSNPIKTSGMVAGSLIGSTGIMSAAARRSSGAGAASRFAIQPGEELVTIGANKLAKRSNRFSKVVDELPGGRLDNEELALEVARRGKKRVSPGVRRARYDLSQRVSTNSDSSMRGILRDESRRKVTDGGKGPKLSQELKDELGKFFGDDRGSLQMGKLESPKGEVEVDVENTDVEQPDTTNFEPDRSTILEGSPRDRISDEVSARSIEDTRASQGDFESVQRPFNENARQDLATFDPDEIQSPTDFERRPTRMREDAGEDFSGFLKQERQFAQQSQLRQQTQLQQVTQPRASEVSVDLMGDSAFQTRSLFRTAEAQATQPAATTARDSTANLAGVELSGLEANTDLEAESEVSGDLESEFETEQEFGQELDLEFGFETEFEQEFEFETESEFESEVETELRGFGESPASKKDDSGQFGTLETQFVVDLPDAGDLLFGK